MNRWVRIELAIVDLGWLVLVGTAVQGRLSDPGPESEALHAQLAWAGTLLGLLGWSWLALYPWFLGRARGRRNERGAAVEGEMLGKAARVGTFCCLLLVSFFAFSSATYEAGLPRVLHPLLALLVVVFLLIARFRYPRQLARAAAPPADPRPGVA